MNEVAVDVDGVDTGVLVSAVTRTDITLDEDWKPELSELDLYAMKATYDLDKFADEWLSRYSR